MGKVDISTLPKYGSIKKCPKCGGKNINSQYCTVLGGSILTSCGGLYGGKLLDEHMDRWCARCGYFWVEKCLS